MLLCNTYFATDAILTPNIPPLAEEGVLFRVCSRELYFRDIIIDI